MLIVMSFCNFNVILLGPWEGGRDITDFVTGRYNLEQINT